MKGNILFAILMTAFVTNNNAQTPNYSENVASIIYDNCSGCHHVGGIAPFSLMSYNEVFNYAWGISYNVSNRTMPPWPADSIEGGFVHERKLSTQEIATIVDWVNGGTPEGNVSLAPDPPILTGEYVLGTPDLQLRAPVYTSKAISVDEYVCFTIPTGLTSDKWVESIEVIPGAGGIVHHCLVFIDSDNSHSADTSSGQCGGPQGETLMGEYVPGSTPIIYPNEGNNKFGVQLKAGSQLLLAMHYPEGSQGTKDSTKVNLHFYPEGTTGIREVYADAIIQNWNFCIDSEKVDTLLVRYPSVGGLPFKVSVMSVFPHMHLLGQRIYAWAITPSNDSIPLGGISEWDFEWQGFYVYKKLKILPAGSVIYGRAVYDNTSNNIHNPNSPPKKVCAGTNTSDEMFLIYFQFLIYAAGDEGIDIDGILNPVGAKYATPLDVLLLDVSPNPVIHGSPFKITLPSEEAHALKVFDINGKVVHESVLSGIIGSYTVKAVLKPGVYLVTLKTDSDKHARKLLVK
jgi:hypothetical protein